MVIHTVARGDSVYSIAQKYGLTEQKIIEDNDLRDIPYLVIGQAVVADTDFIRHIVAPGQSVFSIARLYGKTMQSILSANPSITNPLNIQPGQVINIPVPRQNLGSIEVNGYAYPQINEDTLAKTLPHLTYISIFSYNVRPDGSLAEIDDQGIINAARRMHVAPMMVITNIIEGGSFDSDLAHTILTSEQVQNTLLDNVISKMQSKNYYGLDVDFEYIYPQDRENYNNFLRKTSARLGPLGYSLATSIAPKTSAIQLGLLYEAHDYPVHGALVDHVIIMTYEWGYTFGMAQAVAPLDRVERVIRYAVSAIPREKILMGMPNYGYDWTLPFVRGSAARPLSNTGAVRLAAEVGAHIIFDETSQSPYFTYYDRESRRQHVVWFEDVRSIEAKLRLVNRFRLGGISVWTLSTFFPPFWIVLESMYNVIKVI